MISWLSAEAVAAFDAFVVPLVAVAGTGDQRPWPSEDVQLGAVRVSVRLAVFCPVVVGSELFSQLGAAPAQDTLDYSDQVE
ncbi:hypothetical protein ACWEO9_00625 [Streptomyces albidoflavus]